MIRRAAKLSLLGAACLLAGACSSVVNEDPLAGNIGNYESLMAAVISPARPAEDVARDEARKPLETIAFAGITRGMTIAELVPGGGYYTRILSQAVGPEGRVYAMVPARYANRPGGLDAINAIAEQYGNIDVMVVDDFAAMTAPAPVDMVWTSENYHDLAGGDIAGVNRAVRAMLKPGGVYYVEDHAAPGAGEAALALHRIDPEMVRRQVTQAGFTLADSSDHLANPADPHDQSPFDYQGVTEKLAFRFVRGD